MLRKMKYEMKQVAVFHLFFFFFFLETSPSASLNSFLTVPTKYYNDGTGIVIPASFGLSVVTDPPLKFQ